MEFQINCLLIHGCRFLLARFNIDYICQQTTAKKVLVALKKIKSSSGAGSERPLDPTYDRVIETLRS